MNSRNAHRLLSLAAVTALAAYTVACATKPSNVQLLPANSDPSAEIAKTDEMIAAARDRQVDVLSPKNFEKAQKDLADAKELRAKEKPNEKILEEISYSRSWLQIAEEKSQISRASMKNITDARAGAWRAGADRNFPKEWRHLEADTKDLTEKIEKGILPSDRQSAEIVSRYQDLEIKTVTASTLGKAQTDIKNSIDNGGRKHAPKTLSNAEAKYRVAEDLIIQDPRNSDAINRAAQEATMAAARAVVITNRVRGVEGSYEDMVLKDEHQQKVITGLREETTELEGEQEQTSSELAQLTQEKEELTRKQAIVDKAEKVRKQFNPNEAEVYTQGDKVLIRLKGLQFPSNKADITPKSANLLKKVETALNDLNGSRVIVEGHTDSIGTAVANKIVSERRAQSVQEFLVSDGKLDPDRIEAVGKGYERPISDNKTSLGRAQNRRVDVIVEME